MGLNVMGMGRAARCAGALAIAALLASCGGGGQVQSFVATRVVAFGDETSVITADQKKYTVNAVVAGTSQVDCANNPIWIQLVAGLYGLRFPECPGTDIAPVSRIRAVAGARVDDLAGQIAQQVADGGLGAGDMVTVLVGQNDVLDQFAQYPALDEGQLLANLDAAGAALAGQVNALAALGAKVLISTIPDLGLTPFAGDRSVANPTSVLLTKLSARFNDALLANLTNDGHKIGLIQLDENLQIIEAVRAIGQGSYTNTTAAACAVALPDCTTDTLVTGGNAVTWLWADALHLSAGGQAGLGTLAASRALNNPF